MRDSFAQEAAVVREIRDHLRKLRPPRRAEQIHSELDAALSASAEGLASASERLAAVRTKIHLADLLERESQDFGVRPFGDRLRKAYSELSRLADACGVAGHFQWPPE